MIELRFLGAGFSLTSPRTNRNSSIKTKKVSRKKRATNPLWSYCGKPDFSSNVENCNFYLQPHNTN